MKHLALILALFVATSTTWSQVTPPLLECVNTSSANVNDLRLEWELPVNGCGPFISYELWGATNSAGPFSLITTTTSATQDTFIHTGALATSPTWCYFMQSNFNCPGVPATQSPVVCNTFEVPAYETINVTDTGIWLDWDTAANPQVDGYVIAYLLPNGNPVPLDTVFGIDNTTYFDTISVTTDPSLAYTLYTFNACGATSNSNSLPFSPVFIDPDSEVDRCDREIQLQWQPYRSPYGIATSQEVWLSINGGPDTLLAALDSLRDQLIYFGFDDGDSLVFEVRALALDDGRFVANSAHFVVEASIVQPPNDFYILGASVNPDGTTTLEWTLDSTAELTHYSPQAGTDTLAYDAVERFAVPRPLTALDTFIDTVTDATADDHVYQILAEDSCGIDHFSTRARAMWLRGQQEDFFVNGLQWNAYAIEHGTVNLYRLYRDFGAGYQQVATFSPTDRRYEDDISEFFRQTGSFCYYVEAEVRLDLPDGRVLDRTATSNVFCFQERPVIYVPNAFLPNGLNDVFAPTIFLSEVNDYSLQVFSRWGERIFESDDVNVGWDGTDNGRLVPVGGYAYIIRFTAGDGTRIERKGVVAVVH